MGKGLTVERVRSDVEVLARAGLDVPTFLAEVDASIRRAIPNDAMCVSVQDPATSLTTATFKFGGLVEQESHDSHWCEIEFTGGDATSFRNLATQRQVAVGMHLETDGDVRRSVRMRDFMDPHFGFTDELRTVASIESRAWGAFAMMRADTRSPFDETDVGLMDSLSTSLACGLRAGVLVACMEATPDTTVGPGVIIVQADETVAQMNPDANRWLEELARCDNSHGPVHTLAALVHACGRYARGESPVPPRTRVRLSTGTWVVLHCSPLTGPGASGTDVVITIEEARPPEIIPLVVAAFDLTPREQDVTELVLQGTPSKEVASTLNISVHTVQDHLKSVFEKAGVRSRRELMARIFFDQYRPVLREGAIS